jgi:hypothetical protein
MSPQSNGAPTTEAWTILFALFAAGNLANVPGTGPLNEHFVRDIGCIFTLIGVTLAVAVFRPRFRLTALLFATGFYLAHALVHVFDQIRGLLPPGQWQFDLGPVYGAALLLVVLSFVLARQSVRA